MCYTIETYVTRDGSKPVLDFIFEQDKKTQDWIFAGISQLEKGRGIIRTQSLETKHIKNKIFELKFREMAVRILFAYHPVKRAVVLLLHGVIKKRDDLRTRDIKIAEERYEEVKRISRN